MKIERSTQRGFMYCSTVYVHRNEWMITWWMDGYFVRSWMKEDRSFFWEGYHTLCATKNNRGNTSPSLMRPYFDFLRRRSFVLCVVDARLCFFLFLVFVSPQNRQGSSPFPLSLSVDDNKQQQQHDKKYHWPFLRFICFLVSIQTSHIHSFPSLSSFVLCVVKWVSLESIWDIKTLSLRQPVVEASMSWWMVVRSDWIRK